MSTKYVRLKFLMTHRGNRKGTENVFPEEQAERILSQGVAERVEVPPVTMKPDNVETILQPFQPVRK